MGRYLIDIPEAFGNILHEGIFIGDAKIETKRLYLPAFEQRIQLREQELKATKYVDPKNMPFLKKVYRLQGNLKGVIFDRNQNTSVPGYARVLEAHLYDNGVAFIITMEFIELSDDKYKEDRDFYIRHGFSEIEYNKLHQTLYKMNSLIARISGRKDTEIPTVAGTCIPDGFITGSRYEMENITFVYQGNESDHFNFSIEILNDIKEKNNMLDRISGMEGMLLAMRVKTIRKGKRKINGTHTEEILASGSEGMQLEPETKITRYMFNLIANETLGDYKNPFVNIELKNDRESPTPYSENELVAFWDAVTKTFRKRPGAFGER
ncbi:T6SS immunity protein Tli4 family protein [Photorhabdus africana]|uniref:T6SS immunity protein Tli4 family protein n=1 Tax=Photorhabdus africana TaxID=3097554 RepID=UPI002B4126F7|nr:T6SS immunity protein Tli4 family protein [Photorhabdus sp. CRI-LC]